MMPEPFCARCGHYEDDHDADGVCDADDEYGRPCTCEQFEEEGQ